MIGWAHFIWISLGFAECFYQRLLVHTTFVGHHTHLKGLGSLQMPAHYNATWGTFASGRFWAFSTVLHGSWDRYGLLLQHLETKFARGMQYSGRPQFFLLSFSWMIWHEQFLSGHQKHHPPWLPQLLYCSLLQVILERLVLPSQFISNNLCQEDQVMPVGNFWLPRDCLSIRNHWGMTTQWIVQY